MSFSGSGFVAGGGVTNCAIATDDPMDATNDQTNTWKRL
jgi:hypothetical protein